MIATAAPLLHADPYAVGEEVPEHGIEESYGLGACEAMLAEHMEAVRRHYGPEALGVIDLPSLQPGRLVPEQIRVCGVLYWTSELEHAGLLPFVEALAEGIVRGSIVEPLGGAVVELTRFWRTREQRFGAVERRALFTRVFGTGSPFESQFIDLVRGLVGIGRAPRDQQTAHLEARVAVSAQQFGSALSGLGVGIAGFAAREIVAQVRTALRIMQQGDMVRVLGGGTPWQILSRHGQRLLGRPVQPDRHLGRAVSGMRIISWLAAEAPAIDAGALRVPRTAAVVREAEAWSAASGVA